MSATRRNHQFGPNIRSFRYISYYSFCTTDELGKNSNNLEKYHRYASWIFQIRSPPQCPLSVETTNFAPTTLNFDISNYVFTKDERSKKSNYLGKYRRYAFWVFGIILPLKYSLSVKTTDFAPTSLNFNIANYLCTKDERSKNHVILENIADTNFQSLGLYHPQNIRYPQKPAILPQKPSISTYLIMLLVLRTSGVKNRIISENITDKRFESWRLYHPWNVCYP